LSKYKFPLDGKRHCDEWFNTYLFVILAVIIIAALIIIGNVAVEVSVTIGA
jgi:hypothetical protein